MNKNIEISTYNPNWPHVYEVEADRIKRALGNLLISIHHIGSTSVANLEAKPIIDIMPIMPIVSDISALDKATKRMEALGYEAKGEYGIPFRRYFHKVGFHVHVFDKISSETQRHLLFRNWMRDHSDDRPQYAKLKQNLALSYPDDINQYMLGKDSFIRNIDSMTGFNGLRIARTFKPREWEAAKSIHNKYVKDRNFIDNDQNYTHLVLYKGVEIIGYAAIKFLQDETAKVETILFEEYTHIEKYKEQFTNIIKKWLELLGLKFYDQ